MRSTFWNNNNEGIPTIHCSFLLNPDLKEIPSPASLVVYDENTDISGRFNVTLNKKDGYFNCIISDDGNIWGEQNKSGDSWWNIEASSWDDFIEKFKIGRPPSLSEEEWKTYLNQFY